MKRRLFFVFDRLRITRAERISLLSLTVALFATMLGGAAFRPANPFDEAYYARADSLFSALSAEKDRTRTDIMARYEPAADAGNTAQKASLAVGPTGQATSPISSSQPKSSQVRSGKPKAPDPEGISLNRSTATELAKLPGIGPKTAEAIVAFRQQNGPFQDLSAITKVKGIGPKKWEQIRPYLRLD